MTVLSALGVGGFVLLQYDTLHDHDYYVINLLVVMVWPLLSFLVMLHQRYPQLYRNWILKGLFLLFVGTNITHARGYLASRYDGSSYNNRLPHLEALAPKLKSLGIAQNDLVFCIPDESPNITLQILNRSGWTVYGNGSTERIQNHIDEGAKWLIVHAELTEIYHQFAPYMATPPDLQEGDIKIWQLP